MTKYDIGFNHLVGNKWPLKGWPMESWKRLEKLIGSRYSVSWQQGQDDMQEYFNWINSCRVLITNDSFGMHMTKHILFALPLRAYHFKKAFLPAGLPAPLALDVPAHIQTPTRTTASPSTRVGSRVR